jgi:putative transposase
MVRQTGDGFRHLARLTFFYRSIDMIIHSNISSVLGDKMSYNGKKLDNNNHSVFLIYYHLVLVIKYRQKVLDDLICNRAREIFEYIAPNYHITLQEWNHDQDHIHLLFKAHPNSALAKFINAYKSASSRLLKKEFPYIRKKLWKEYFWSRSYCLLTTGGVSIETIQRYIASQGKKGGEDP